MTRLILAVVLLIIAILIAAAVRALILAATRHGQGRHQFDRDLEAMCPTPGDDPVKYAAELLGLPAKGEDYISDQNVRLPWTPPLMKSSGPPFSNWDERCSDPPEESCADAGCPVHRSVEAEVDEDEPDDDPTTICQGCFDGAHCDGEQEWCCCTCTWDEDWAEEDEEPFESDDDFIESVAPFLPPAATLTDAEVAEIKARFLAAQMWGPQILLPGVEYDEPRPDDAADDKCHCGKPAGHLEAALAGDHPEAAFDTGVIPAVKIDA